MHSAILYKLHIDRFVFFLYSLTDIFVQSQQPIFTWQPFDPLLTLFVVVNNFINHFLERLISWQLF